MSLALLTKVHTWLRTYGIVTKFGFVLCSTLEINLKAQDKRSACKQANLFSMRPFLDAEPEGFSPHFQI